MSRRRLALRRALQTALAGYRRHPGQLLGFSAAAVGLHLLGWALFAAADLNDSGVLGLLLHAAGIAVYAGSLLWLLEGLSRAGLAVTAGRPLRWRALCRWPGPRSWPLACGLINLAVALVVTALSGFVAWSLVLYLLPALQVLPVLLAVVAGVAVMLSQLLNSCLVLEAGLSPSAAFRQGFLLLERHWAGLLGLGAALCGLLLSPLLLGLLSEGLLPGCGVAATGLGLLAVLPLAANSVAAAYRQLETEPSPSGAPISGSDR